MCKITNQCRFLILRWSNKLVQITFSNINQWLNKDLTSKRGLTLSQSKITWRNFTVPISLCKHWYGIYSNVGFLICTNLWIFAYIAHLRKSWILPLKFIAFESIWIFIKYWSSAKVNSFDFFKILVSKIKCFIIIIKVNSKFMTVKFDK